MENNSSGGPLYDAGIFVDNDEKNVVRVATCGLNMKTILVPMNETPIVNLTSPEMMEYVSTLSPEGQETTRIIHRMSYAVNNPTEMYDAGSGIHVEHVEEIKNWVLGMRKEDSTKRLAALFDWDRTLTIMEGMWSFGSDGLAGFPRALLPHFESFPDLVSVMENWNRVTPKGLIEYYCGGPERVNMLQDMFDFLYDNNVDVYVLTNNPSCKNNLRLLEELMNVLTRNRRVGYVCSNIEMGLDKKKAVQRNSRYSAAFRLICPPDPERDYNVQQYPVMNNEEDLQRWFNELAKGGRYRKKTMKKKQKRATRKKLNKRARI